MRQTIKLGHIAGIPIGVHWSVLVIMLLLAQGLALSLLPAAAPHQSGVAYWLVALAVTAVFLAALVAHEAAHSVVARRYGVGVKSITLWLLGGVSELEGEAPHARADLAIAIAGPLTSFGTAIVFGAGAFAAGRAGAPRIAVAALVWLAAVNLILAVFNLLPGAPLDGGRVLRAAIWWARGDRLAAQRIASRAGMIMGGVLIVGGLLEIFLTRNLGGIWLALIGWFLLAAARAEGLEAQTRNRLAGVKVGDVMSTPVITGGEGQSVEAFVDSVARNHPHRTYPVLSMEGQLTGLVSLARLGRVPAEQRPSTRLAELRTPLDGVVTLRAGDELTDVATKMMGDGQRTAVVLDGDGGVAGMLSASDIAKRMELSRMGAGLPRVG